jgi:peptidoglycan L-alanyl-D-glutamate endopeptidase CwlK
LIAFNVIFKNYVAMKHAQIFKTFSEDYSMAADLQKLQPTLKTKLLDLIDRCASRGIVMRPSNGLRDPFEQGKLWRQSRSIEEIDETIKKLISSGAPFLAHCISSVGPQHGSHVTDTPPGVSWHQWGEAVDCFWLVDGKAEWSTKKLINGLNGYKIYANEAAGSGLTAGGLWPKFKDWPHVQLRSESNAASVMSLVEIDREMRMRFDN